MRPSGILLAGFVALSLAACGQDEAGDGRLHSALSEAEWLEYCAHPDQGGDRATCTNREITWVVTLTGQPGAMRLEAHLGPRNSGVGVNVHLIQPLSQFDGDLSGRTFFLHGLASERRDGDGLPSVTVADAEVLGFQTLVGGPKQGELAPEITLAEFGRFCLLAPFETYAEQCGGKRILWYGLLRGTAPDGVILGLPFDDASIARIKTVEPLTWPIGDTEGLADQPIVVEGVLAPVMARRDNRERVPIIEQAHIVAFSQQEVPVEEITGVR